VKGAVGVQIISVPLNTTQNSENLEIFQAAARIIHAEVHLYDRYNQNQQKSEKNLPRDRRARSFQLSIRPCAQSQHQTSEVLVSRPPTHCACTADDNIHLHLMQYCTNTE